MTYCKVFLWFTFNTKRNLSIVNITTLIFTELSAFLCHRFPCLECYLNTFCQSNIFLETVSNPFCFWLQKSCFLTYHLLPDWKNRPLSHLRTRLRCRFNYGRSPFMSARVKSRLVLWRLELRSIHQWQW